MSSSQWTLKDGRPIGSGAGSSWDDWAAEGDFQLSSAEYKEVEEYLAANQPRVDIAEAVDELARQKELSAFTTKKFMWADQADLAGHPSKLGRLMTHAEFITKLRNAGLTCFYAGEARGAIGLRAIRPGYEQIGLQFVCAVQGGYMPEYSVIHFDERGLPLSFKYIGWRGRVLLELIRKGFLTEEKAHKVFGKPEGFASRRYKEILQGLRNARQIA